MSGAEELMELDAAKVGAPFQGSKRGTKSTEGPPGDPPRGLFDAHQGVGVCQVGVSVKR